MLCIIFFVLQNTKITLIFNFFSHSSFLFICFSKKYYEFLKILITIFVKYYNLNYFLVEILSSCNHYKLKYYFFECFNRIYSFWKFIIL